MNIYHVRNDGQLVFIDNNLKKVKRGEKYIMSDLLTSDGLFVEKRENRFHDLQIVCGSKGQKLPAVLTNDCVDDMKEYNILSYINITTKDRIIFFKRFDKLNEDPTIIICRVIKIDQESNEVEVFIEDKFFYWQIEDRKNIDKFKEAVKFGVSKQLDIKSYIKDHYSINHSRLYENCLFIRRYNKLISYTRNGKKVVLHHRSKVLQFYKDYYSTPSILFMKIFYPKHLIYTNRDEYYVDGFSYNLLMKDEWMDHIKSLEKSFDSLNKLVYVTTVDGDTFLAFDNKYLEAIIKTPKGFDTIEINNKQREYLVKNIKNAYFDSIESIFAK